MEWISREKKKKQIFGTDENKSIKFIIYSESQYFGTNKKLWFTAFASGL